MFKKFFDWLLPSYEGDAAAVVSAADAMFWAKNGEAMSAALDAKVMASAAAS